MPKILLFVVVVVVDEMNIKHQNAENLAIVSLCDFSFLVPGKFPKE